MNLNRKKESGAYYTPDDVVQSLVSWAVSCSDDRMLDPSCGDGRFLMVHPKSVGVESDPEAAAVVQLRTPGSLLHQGDFFAWAATTRERFECAAGKPPFIRYQRFTGAIRAAAISICARNGADFSSLSSSWAPFLVATASLLKPNGRMAFVAPAEIGHAPYAAPLIRFLMDNFSKVQVIAVEEKLFPELSEDCWLLYCEGFGGKTDAILLSQMWRFSASTQPPRQGKSISASELEKTGLRLRPFLLSPKALELYSSLAFSSKTFRLSDVARIGIGYVTGANDFFHLKPSLARRLGINDRFLFPAVRNGRDLMDNSISQETVIRWRSADDPHFLLRIKRDDAIPIAVQNYLDSAEGRIARESYKCRNRQPWYSVPDVQVPDAFLSYMSGLSPSLVANAAGCVATNSVHVVRLKPGIKVTDLQYQWGDPLTQLSCEVEGHPLGGGMLKLEPREASRIVVRRDASQNPEEADTLMDAVETMRRWRHYG